MPSPCSKKNGSFYKRKGGAWKASKKGGAPKKVGYGKGNLSRRNIKQDKKRHAQHRLKKYQNRYSNHSDGKGEV